MRTTPLTFFFLKDFIYCRSLIWAKVAGLAATFIFFYIYIYFIFMSKNHITAVHSCLPSTCLPDWIQGEFALQHYHLLAVSGFHRAQCLRLGGIRGNIIFASCVVICRYLLIFRNNPTLENYFPYICQCVPIFILCVCPLVMFSTDPGKSMCSVLNL